MNKILFGTNNLHKIEEFYQIFAALRGIGFISPHQINLDMDVDETGKTYSANAQLKSAAFANASGLITLADDSGLEVDALEGAPGVYSARYGNLIDGSDKDRRELLVENLKSYSRPWHARFRCIISVSIPDNYIHSPVTNQSLIQGITQTFEGVCEGEIIPVERGAGGFGYDPVFQIANSSKTMAELDSEEKNKISHRGLAGLAAVPYLKEILGL